MTQENKESWTINIIGEKFKFMRFINGKLDESYPPVDASRAAIYASAIIQGFEPPRDLQRSDIRAG